MPSANSDWPFADEKNVAVITTKSIASGEDWISYVTHDEEDGAWQFLPSDGPTSEAEAAVVGLGTITQLDDSIKELADLPLGWIAWRSSLTAKWERAPNQA